MSESALINASVMPAAPSKCPVQPLVELAAVSLPTGRHHAPILGDIVGAAGGAVQIDVIDRRGPSVPRSTAPCASHAPRPRPPDAGSTCGTRRRSRRRQEGCTAPSARGSSSAKPAPSPIEMPSRSAANGRHGRRDSNSSEWNPNSVDMASESTPPTTAASHSPASIARAAAANTLALDEHAVEIVIACPESLR